MQRPNRIRLIGGKFDREDQPWHGEALIRPRRPNYKSLGWTDDGSPEIYAAAAKVDHDWIEDNYTVRSLHLYGKTYLFGVQVNMTDEQALTHVFGEPLR